MPFITQGKANLKYILIVVILAAIVGGGIWFFWQETHPEESILPFQKVWTFEQTLQKALLEKNPQLCDKINKGYIIQDFGVSPEQAREDCKRTYAIEAEDINYCLTLLETAPIGSLSSRDVCLRGLAEKLRKPELCDLMPCVKDEKYGENYRDSCKQAAQDETAGWKTYTSNLLGVTFQHPSSWQADIDHSTVKDSNSNRSFTVIKNFIGGYVEDNLISKEDVEIDDIKTSIAYQNYENNTIAAYIFLRRDGNLYYMVGIWPKEDMEAKDIFKKILSTFKFIENKEDFCGISTKGSCASNADCVTGGCSGQVCQSKNEEPVITTCEMKNCYDETQYGLGCKCIEEHCEWSK